MPARARAGRLTDRPVPHPLGDCAITAATDARPADVIPAPIAAHPDGTPHRYLAYDGRWEIRGTEQLYDLPCPARFGGGFLARKGDMTWMVVDNRGPGHGRGNRYPVEHRTLDAARRYIPRTIRFGL